MKLMTIGEFSKQIGVHPATVRKWECDGKITPILTHGKHRRYTQEHVLEFRNSDQSEDTARVVAYCRISPNEPQPEKLEYQINALQMFALGRGLCDMEVLAEIGDGTDMQRPSFLQLIRLIAEGEVSTLILAHKDRLMSFGFEMFEYMANLRGCEIIALDIEQISSRDEIVDNLVSIVESFSERVENLPSLVAVKK